MPKILESAPAAPECLMPDCSNAPGADLKGLCTKCYPQAKKLVDKEETTWEQLAELGMVDLDFGKKTGFRQEFLRRKSKTSPERL